MGIVIGGQVGEVVKDGKVQSRQFMVGCDRHPKPVPMRRGVTIDKKGKEEAGYTCPKCHQWVSENEVNYRVMQWEEQKAYEKRVDSLRKSTLDKK